MTTSDNFRIILEGRDPMPLGTFNYAVFHTDGVSGANLNDQGDSKVICATPIKSMTSSSARYVDYKGAVNLQSLWETLTKEGKATVEELTSGPHCLQSGRTFLVKSAL